MKDESNRDFSSICVAGTHSGVGKTTITLGLLSALTKRGYKTQPFKCGPDYIDTGHHQKACGVVSRNLDSWMMGEEGVRTSYEHALGDCDVAVLEGVMGLYDGASSDSLHGSTAHICVMLNIPIVLVVDAKAMARSIAAVVAGFSSFEPDVNIIGVIANNVSSKSHEQILKTALQSSGLPPLIGCIPNNEAFSAEERHLGLVTAAENKKSKVWYELLGNTIEEHIDIDRLLTLSKQDRPATRNSLFRKTPSSRGNRSPRIGVARDEAFQFYYQDNLDLLKECGAEIVDFSPLCDKKLPEGINGLYIGGGYPELHCEALSLNVEMRKEIRDFAMADGYIYAECGGLMYLCESLADQESNNWEMCGVLKAGAIMQNKLRRLGYREAITLSQGPFGPPETVIRGHEYHWSDIAEEETSLEPCFTAKSARGDSIKRTGLRFRNVTASYMHLHFMSNAEALTQWVKTLSESS